LLAWACLCGLGCAVLAALVALLMALTWPMGWRMWLVSEPWWEIALGIGSAFALGFALWMGNQLRWFLQEGQDKS